MTVTLEPKSKTPVRKENEESELKSLLDDTVVGTELGSGGIHVDTRNVLKKFLPGEQGLKVSDSRWKLNVISIPGGSG